MLSWRLLVAVAMVMGALTGCTHTCPTGEFFNVDTNQCSPK